MLRRRSRRRLRPRWQAPPRDRAGTASRPGVPRLRVCRWPMGPRSSTETCFGLALNSMSRWRVMAPISNTSPSRRNVREASHAVEVDDVRRLNDPHVHHRHEGLPAARTRASSGASSNPMTSSIVRGASSGTAQAPSTANRWIKPRNRGSRRKLSWNATNSVSIAGTNRPSREVLHDLMKLNTHNRYDYSPITERADYSPLAKVGSCFLCCAQCRAFQLWRKIGSHTDGARSAARSAQLAWRDYGLRVGIWRIFDLTGLIESAAVPPPKFRSTRASRRSSRASGRAAMCRPRPHQFGTAGRFDEASGKALIREATRR